jgi:hypothetical protein
VAFRTEQVPNDFSIEIVTTTTEEMAKKLSHNAIEVLKCIVAKAHMRRKRSVSPN